MNLLIGFGGTCFGQFLFLLLTVFFNELGLLVDFLH